MPTRSFRRGQKRSACCKLINACRRQGNCAKTLQLQSLQAEIHRYRGGCRVQASRQGHDFLYVQRLFSTQGIVRRLPLAATDTPDAGALATSCDTQLFISLAQRLNAHVPVGRRTISYGGVLFVPRNLGVPRVFLSRNLGKTTERGSRPKSPSHRRRQGTTEMP